MNIDHLAALTAHEVMVPVDFPVEPGRCASVLKASDQAPLGQRVEYAVHRGPRDPRNMLLYRFQNLVGRRMVIPLQDSLKNDASLHGAWRPLAPAQRLKGFKSLGDRDSRHSHNRRQFIVTSTMCQSKAMRRPPLTGWDANGYGNLKGPIPCRDFGPTALTSRLCDGSL